MDEELKSSKCNNCEALLYKDNNYCSNCGMKIEKELTDKEKLEKAIKDIKKLEEEIQSLNQRIPPIRYTPYNNFAICKDM